MVKRHDVPVAAMKAAVNCALVYDRKGVVWVELTREVAEGDELFIDYGDEYWKGAYHRNSDNSAFIRDGYIRPGCGRKQTVKRLTYKPHPRRGTKQTVKRLKYTPRE